MPVDSSIALAGKPPVLPEVDFNKTFLTLGQLKYLNSETARTQAGAALVETQGAAALADLAASNRLRAVDPTGGTPAGQPLTSLRTGAVPTGGPPFDTPTLAALPQGGQTTAPGAPTGPPPAGSPPAGAAPVPPPVSTMALARQYLAADPIKGAEVATKLFEHDKQALDATKTQLELGQTRLTIASNAYQGVHDQASLDFANQTIMHVTGLSPEHLVQVYDPARLAQAQDMQRTAKEHLDEQFKKVEQTRQQQEADTARFTAQTAAATEERTGRKYTYPSTPTGIVPLPEYPQRGQEPMGGGSAPHAIPGTAPAMPGGSAEALGYEQRALAAHKLTVQLEDKGVNVAGLVQKGLSSVPVVGNYFTPTEVQQYNQAKSDFLTAISRGESPRMTPQQLALYDQQYFPQPGDDAHTIQQKRASRESALQELRIQTNRPEGLPPPGQTQMPGTAPGAGSAPAASGSAPLWTPENRAAMKRGLIATGESPARAEQIVHQMEQQTPAQPAAAEKPRAATKEVWSQKEFKAWMQQPALKGKFTPAVGLEFLRNKGIEVTP